MKKIFLVIMCALSFMATQAQEKKVLVAYFSCTGNTERKAKAIAETVEADLYRILPQKIYTSSDLDWRNARSRSSIEMNDSAARPSLADKKAKIENYEVIFLGYPIWWDMCPRIINTFLEAYDWTGKIVIPFATSGSSSITNSVKQLKLHYSNLKWDTGKLLNKGTEEAVKWSEEIINSMIK